MAKATPRPGQGQAAWHIAWPRVSEVQDVDGICLQRPPERGPSPKLPALENIWREELSFPHYSDVGTCRRDTNGGVATIRADFQPEVLGCSQPIYRCGEVDTVLQAAECLTPENSVRAERPPKEPCTQAACVRRHQVSGTSDFSPPATFSHVLELPGELPLDLVTSQQGCSIHLSPFFQHVAAIRKLHSVQLRQLPICTKSRNHLQRLALALGLFNDIPKLRKESSCSSDLERAV